MRTPSLVCGLALALAGCGLVLDDPLPFQVKPVEDARPDVADARADFALEDAFVQPDTGPEDAAPDADARPIPEDVGTPSGDADVGPVEPDMGLDAAPPADAGDAAPPVDAGDAGCVPDDEVCDGLDNDCDGDTDEFDPAECSPCGSAEGQGACALGALLCVGGNLQCVHWLPDPDDAVACDLIDNDCDGTTDEHGEAPPAREDEEARVVAVCGEPPRFAAPEAVDDCTLQPRVVGCGAPHACMDPGCVGNCDDTRETALEACAQACPLEPDALSRAECWGDCRVAVGANHLACLTACGEREQMATRWACQGGVGGAQCTALDCPEGFRPAGQGCEPNVEICNNGKDDDRDGVLDGTADGPDPCMVTFEVADQPLQQGLCENDDTRGCEDNARLRAASDQTAARCLPGECPREVTLGYDYAIDREEVSIRAYWECVQSGCCQPPSGRTWQLAAADLEAGSAAARPEAPDGCADQVDPLDPGAAARLPDLPVTGVTWCQARDYCNWVGKRLPTEFEWERAGMGVGPRRAFSWGDAAPARCVEDQCCAPADFSGQPPGLCDGELAVCGEPGQGARQACLGIYGAGDASCPGTFSEPSPVYSNVDGATPTGLLNMTGNVAEWVYDWDRWRYAGVRTDDPVGPACDFDELPNKKGTRGQAYTGSHQRMGLFERNAIFSSTQAPIIGFRCVRTVDPAGWCDPQMPEIQPTCRPGFDFRTGNQGRQPPRACSGPDFDAVNAGELEGCPGIDQRLGAGDCSAGFRDFCATDDVAGCGSFVLSRLELPPVLLGDIEAAALLNTVFLSTLAPQGGSTLFVFGLPDEFANIDREWPATFGSATLNADGNLSFLGTIDQGVCDPSETLNFRVRTVQGSAQLRPVCRARGLGRLWFRATPVSLRISVLGMRATHIAAGGLLTGTLAFVLTLDDLANSTFGDTRNLPDLGGAGAQSVLERAGLSAQNLCNQPISFLGPDCFQEPLLVEGCEGDVCTNPDTCTGFILPFDFEALRADRAGVVGLTACGGE